jgi:hypothetical protein
MISWTTARFLEFEKVRSSSTSSTFATTLFGADVGSSGATTTVTSITSSTYEDSVGTTTNHLGTTTSRTSSSSIESGRTNISGGITSGTSSASGSTTSSSQRTRSIQTTIETSKTTEGATTYESSYQDIFWTYSTYLSWGETQKSFVTEFRTVTKTFASSIALTRTTLSTTTSETTQTHLLDTVYLAEDTEMLWVCPNEPSYSVPIFDLATTATQTTISAMAETLSLSSYSSTSDALTISSTRSTATFFITGQLPTTITRTGNIIASLCPGITTELSFAATSSQDPTTTRTITVSSQPRIVHRNNTETTSALVAGSTTGSRTDVMASASWQTSSGTSTTTEITTSVDNLNSETSVYGNTTRTLTTIGGATQIGSAPTMSVFASYGVGVGESRGLRFVGGPFDSYDPEVETTEGIVGPITCLSGDAVYVAIPVPTTNESVTQKSNSVTFSTQTAASEYTTTLATLSIDGSMWIQPARSRTGLIGGTLATGETGLIRIARGLYRDQSGGTSFYEGNDTTFTDSLPSSYLTPMTYLIPTTAEESQVVLAVPRNTSTWPTA